MIETIQKKQTNEDLVREYVDTRNASLKERVIKAYLSLVRHIVGRMNIPEHALLGKEDLYQFGVVGLIEALERYHPDYGTTFKTFAYKRIYGEIVDAIRKTGILNRDQAKNVNRLLSSVETLQHRLGREPSIREVCQEADISEQEYYNIEMLNRLNFSLSLDEKIYEDSTGSQLRRDTIPDDMQLNPEETLDLESIKNNLKHIISQLSEKQRLVLALYYYEELTLMDIGTVLNLSESRVSQILKETLIELRQKANL